MNRLRLKLATLLFGNYAPTPKVEIVEKIEIVPEGSMHKQPVFCLQVPNPTTYSLGYKDEAYILNLEDALEWRRKDPSRRTVGVTEGYIRGDQWYSPVTQHGRPLHDPMKLPE